MAGIIPQVGSDPFISFQVLLVVAIRLKSPPDV